MDHIQRPQAIVLSDSALVPDRNLQPPPTEFTHEVVASQPYYYIGPQQASPPEGSFPAGTKVKLHIRGEGSMCEVVDARGLCVTTSFAGLRPISET